MKNLILLLFLLLSSVALLLAPAASAQPDLWCWNADNVYATVDGANVSVFHDAAAYNCGLVGFEFSVVQEGSIIQVAEAPVIEMWALCNCCFSASVVIENVSPGPHVIDYAWSDVDGQGQHRYLDIVVPDVGQGGVPGIGNQTASNCQQEPPAAIDPGNRGIRASTPRGRLSLHAPSPNPVISSTSLEYRLEEEMWVKLSIYSAGGSWVRDLRQGPGRPGVHTAVWDGNDGYSRRAPAGLYFCRLSGGGEVVSRPLILLR